MPHPPLLARTKKLDKLELLVLPLTPMNRLIEETPRSIESDSFFDSQEARMKSFAYAFAAALVAVSVLAQAQTPASYPTKPITIVVPYPAGGTSDNQVRIISEPLSKILGQPV